MRCRSTLAALALLAAAVVAASAPLAAQTPERSTGNLETREAPATPAAPETAKPAEPAKPQAPVNVAFAAGEKKRLVEGKTRAGDPAVVLFTAPVEQMLNIRLASPANQAILLVYQPGASEPDPGTREQDGAIGWTGICEKPGDLKLEIRSKSEKDLPFRLDLALPTGEGQP